MSLQAIDVAPIATAVLEKQKAEAAITKFGDEVARGIADLARTHGVLNAETGTLNLPRGYSVEVFYGEARLRWPRPFLPTGEKLLSDIKDGWLDSVADHITSHKPRKNSA
ncbi:MAG TPA: hypothetical protein VGK19_05745 [Capsulimonadaceae bacterium]